MTRPTGQTRKPAAFRIDPETADSVAGRPGSVHETPFPEQEAADAPPLAPRPGLGRRHRRGSWGLIFISALMALLSLGVGLALTSIIESLFARHAWLGWAGLGLTVLAGLAAAMLAARELAALLRQRRITHIGKNIDLALHTGDADLALAGQAELTALYRGRGDLAWAIGRLAEHDGDILDAPDRLALAERELMRPLDSEAKALIAGAAKRVSILTAVSPSALVDISFVAAINLRLMRALAELYGGRPGLIGLLRLARMVLTHLTLTGGIALGDDMLQQLLGHSLASRISSRLGEGVLNGTMTARIGLAAMQVCRPMPFRAVKPPGLKAMVGTLISSRSGKTAPK